MGILMQSDQRQVQNNDSGPTYVIQDASGQQRILPPNARIITQNGQTYIATTGSLLDQKKQDFLRQHNMKSSSTSSLQSSNSPSLISMNNNNTDLPTLTTPGGQYSNLSTVSLNNNNTNNGNNTNNNSQQSQQNQGATMVIGPNGTISGITGLQPGQQVQIGNRLYTQYVNSETGQTQLIPIQSPPPRKRTNPRSVNKIKEYANLPANITNKGEKLDKNDFLVTDLATNEKVHACDIGNCDATFKRFEDLARHRRMHSADRPYACDFPGCDFTSKRKDNLQSHKKTHEAKKHFCQFVDCQRKDRGFTRRDELKRHYESHIRKLNKKIQNSSSDSDKILKLIADLNSIIETSLINDKSSNGKNGRKGKKDSGDSSHFGNNNGNNYLQVPNTNGVMTMNGYATTYNGQTYLPHSTQTFYNQNGQLVQIVSNGNNNNNNNSNQTAQYNNSFNNNSQSYNTNAHQTNGNQFPSTKSQNNPSQNKKLEEDRLEASAVEGLLCLKSGTRQKTGNSFSSNNN